MSPRQTITITSLSAALAALAAGCGSGSPTAGNPHANSPVQAAYAFSRCMRQHGVANFPDPKVSVTPGQTRIAQMAPQGVVNSPAFKTAQRACSHLQPGPGSGDSRHQGPGKQALLAFASCLRAHGLTDFPDPNTQGQITSQMIGAAGIDLHQPAVLTAARNCVGATHGAITMAMVQRAINHH
jgi:hypothetical protein